MSEIVQFFCKMGEKNPEFVIVVVFALLMTILVLLFILKMEMLQSDRDKIIQTLFNDYKKTVGDLQIVLDKIHCSLGEYNAIIRKCVK